MNWEIAIPALVGAGAALLTRAGERLLAKFFDRSVKRDAQQDADLAAIERVVFEVRDLATSYWSKDPDPSRDKVTEGAIVGRLTFLTELSDELFRARQKSQRAMQVAVNRYDVSCTFGDFGSHSRRADSGKCRDIEIAAYRLVHLAKAERRRL
ncbi:MAG: hypothetical protein QM656_00275 [Paracoccaceae bacterium]